jgi:transcriptional regulator with XRE-family HTH domain
MDRRQRELADFLRSKRERLKPAAAGLPSGMRRRTPGLRREEVAELAGIGTGWYTFLEQGRDVRPSEGVLRRIGKALQLDGAERRYLLRLGLEPAPSAPGPEMVVPELACVIRSMTTPAIVLGRAWDVLDCNEAANALFDFRYLPCRNYLRLTFTPEFRSFHANWEQTVRQLVGAFRAQHAASLRDPRIVDLVDDLEEHCPQFRHYWGEQTVREENSGHWTCDHPSVGRLRFNFVMLGVLDSPGLVVKLYSPGCEETRRRLDELTHQLRAGERSPAHNLWSALAARIRGPARNGCAA